jgi:zinc/manganese transport system substrate-binding protein
MRRRSVLFAALALPALLPGRLRAQAPVRVVASFSILGDMVAEVGGDRVQVRTIAGPNTDAHSFQPRPSDAEALRGAALVVRNGLGFEGWMDRMIRSANYRGPIVTTTDGITPRSMAGHSHSHGHGGAERRQNHAVGPRTVPDPHAWQDPRLGAVYARNIARGLAAADPASAAAHQAAGEAYATRIEAIDGWIRQQLAGVPEARRKVVTSHDAFGYFGAAYGIRFLAPQGVSTEGEPSAQQVGNLIRQIRAENITAVFIENMANPATLERLAREAGVRVRGKLFADALSESNGPAPTYEAMFRHNLGLLVPAMRGDAA